jgi:hypothetical protein
MPQRRSIVFGSLFVAGFVMIAWTEYYPSSGMFDALGMPGPTARNGRVCGYIYSERYHWQQQQYIRRLRRLLPSRAVNCSRVLRGASPMERENVSVDALNRKLLHAHRMWSDLDSAQWQRERDSIAFGMARRGGHEIGCAKSPYPLPHIRDTRYWKFSNFSVRLVAYKWEREIPGGRWLLQLDGYPTLPDECVYDPWSGRTPAPDVCAQAVFRMPLPFDRQLCVRSWLWN